MIYRGLGFLLCCSMWCLSITAAPSFEEGKKIYLGSGACAACHQANGKGLLGNVPPLNKSPWVTDRKDRLIAIVLKGLNGPIKVNGQVYFGSMPPQLQLNDEQVSHLLTYIRAAWGNKADAVLPEEVAAVRKLVKNDGSHVDELLKRFPFTDKRMSRGNGKGVLKSSDEHFDTNRTTVVRTFMPGASPAAFAVALPGGPYYCWDAGECRLRYVWREGGFISERKKHWATNGKPVVTFRGLPYFTAYNSKFNSDHFNETNLTNHYAPVYDTEEVNDLPLQWEDGTKAKAKFLGYRLIKGKPQFRYTFDRFTVSELIDALPEQKGIVRLFKIEKIDRPIRFKLNTSPKAKIRFDRGVYRSGYLYLSPSEARSFKIEIEEVKP